MVADIKFLESLPHFAGLSQDGLESVREFIFEKNYERNEMILYEDEESDALYIVYSGLVKTFKTSPEGKEQILYINRSGDSLNDIPAFDNDLNPASAQAMSPVSLYGIQIKDLGDLLNNYSQVTYNVIGVLSKHARRLVSLVEDLSFKHVIGRVAKILLEHVREGSGSQPRLTQQDMAAIAGTAREVIGRSLKSLEDDGFIRLERQRVVLTDEEALKEIAGVTS